LVINIYKWGITMLLKKKKKEKTEKPKKIKNNSFSKMPTLNKLRIMVGSIFGLSTLSLVLILAGVWLAGAVLALISYLLVLVLTAKLFLVKKL
jgi:hypothetical protein